MWKASNTISLVLTLAISVTSVAADVPGANETLASIALALDNALLGVTHPIDSTVLTIGNYLCQPLTPVLVSDQNPDVSQITLQYRSQNMTIAFNMSNAAVEIPRQLPQYDPTKLFLVFVHGFTGNLSKSAFVDFYTALEANGEYMILGLDASSLISNDYNYVRAAYATYAIGVALGKVFVDLKQQNGHLLYQIHCIGHSLGAHICANSGYHTKNKTGQQIGRITGLDSAGPCFMNMPSYAKLTQAAAMFVDIFHTNAGVFGTNEITGHVDFYLNDGTQQPGCPTDGCGHSRAPMYYSESVNRTTAFQAVQCNTYEDFRKGNCLNVITVMGYSCSNTTRGIYFAQTAAMSPFGLGAAGTYYDPARVGLLQNIENGIGDLTK